MDAGIDFIRPEFLSIIFFQQKNLVVFPYTDIKHLHALEIFTVGYNTVDFESTALHNMKEIVESEVNNSYSQNPLLFFIYNLDKKALKEIMEIEGIRCILNINEIITPVVTKEEFVFFNKKNNSFLNYNHSSKDLEFEKYLIQSSKNQSILLDKIQKIKSVANTIFSEYVESGELNFLNEILVDYPQKFWNKILKFVELYFAIELPEITQVIHESLLNYRKKTNSQKTFIREYEFIINTNKPIAREFVQVLHDYRHEKINPANLELDQLYDPQKLYDYLRNHHWNDQIPKDFLEKWISMKYTKFNLSELDKQDFEKILKYLKIPEDIVMQLIPKHDIENNSKTARNAHKKSIPSMSDFIAFKKWFLETLERVETQVFGKAEDQMSKPLNLKKNKKKLVFAVDGANVAFHTLAKNNGAHLMNIKNVYNALRQKGAKIIKIICDASLAHKIDYPEAYQECLGKKLIFQAPAGVPADMLLLNYAKENDAFVVSNDLFSEYRNQYGEEWINEKRIPFWIMEGKVSFDERKL
ncbi:MAG: hypothetical protein ACFFAS_14930 [Promethearchaeota archaeon]